MKWTHTAATLNLAPSSVSVNQLRGLGVRNLRRWGRGVDADLFSPTRRDEALHAAWAPQGESVVGFMGRLAPEKQVADLEVVADLPETRIVVVGDGPDREALQRRLPDAVFCGSDCRISRCNANFCVQSGLSANENE